MEAKSFGISLEVSGDYALYSRPEFKTERMSYPILTPSAARGILEAIYWKPEIRWDVDKIGVLNPIQFVNIRRNEINAKIPVKGGTGVNAAMKAGEGMLRLVVDEHRRREQRASLLLRDVRYWIQAHFEILVPRMVAGGPKLPVKEIAGKHLDIFKRRARTGSVFQQPYLGCREFPARFRLIESGEQLPVPHESLMGEHDFGLMLHDIEFDQDCHTKRVRSTKSRIDSNEMTPERVSEREQD